MHLGFRYIVYSYLNNNSILYIDALLVVALVCHIYNASELKFIDNFNN